MDPTVPRLFCVGKIPLDSVPICESTNPTPTICDLHSAVWEHVGLNHFLKGIIGVKELGCGLLRFLPNVYLVNMSRFAV